MDQSAETLHAILIRVLVQNIHRRERGRLFGT